MTAVMDKIGICDIEQESRHQQGFVDQWGIFIDRKKAKRIAIANGQKLREPFNSDEAYSENFW